MKSRQLHVFLKCFRMMHVVSVTLIVDGSERIKACKSSNILSYLSTYSYNRKSIVAVHTPPQLDRINHNISVDKHDHIDHTIYYIIIPYNIISVTIFCNNFNAEKQRCYVWRTRKRSITCSG